MGNSNSAASSKEQKTTTKTTLRPPKKMLWGCATAEDHYRYTKESCAKIANRKGAEGLALLGFEYRIIHDNEGSISSSSGSNSSHVRSPCSDMGNDDDLNSLHNLHDDCYMIPTKGGGSSSDGSDDGNSSTAGGMQPSTSALDLLEFRYLTMEAEPSPAKRIARVASAASMFSLSTHFTYESNDGDDIIHNTAINNLRIIENDHHLQLQNGSTDFAGTMRLFHNPSNVMITNDNYETYISYGLMYNEVARLCMEYAQEVMIEEGNLEWVTVCPEQNIRALVSRDRFCSTEKKKKEVLLVITGKGDVRTGIFSRRYLITGSIEVSTALTFIREAIERGMAIVMLDPNAKGSKVSMQTVQTSLEKLFFSSDVDQKQQQDNTNNLHDANEDNKENIFVLAHSMAGSQIVRILHDKICPPGSSSNNGTSNDQEEELTDGISFLNQIKAIAFTDSNHNINWINKNNQPLTDLLVGSSSLYIKSHRIHDDAKTLGAMHHDCPYWKRRFGAIRTLWAGTHEHALTNFTARSYIWDHFDTYIDKSVITDTANSTITDTATATNNTIYYPLATGADTYGTKFNEGGLSDILSF